MSTMIFEMYIAFAYVKFLFWISALSKLQCEKYVKLKIELTAECVTEKIVCLKEIINYD